jgi:hypothetical protein
MTIFQAKNRCSATSTLGRSYLDRTTLTKVISPTVRAKLAEFFGKIRKLARINERGEARLERQRCSIVSSVSGILAPESP